jgi:hypothetical protein
MAQCVSFWDHKLVDGSALFPAPEADIMGQFLTSEIELGKSEEMFKVTKREIQFISIEI